MTFSWNCWPWIVVISSPLRNSLSSYALECWRQKRADSIGRPGTRPSEEAIEIRKSSGAV
jgi:hypothetical protein